MRPQPIFPKLDDQERNPERSCENYFRFNLQLPYSFDCRQPFVFMLPRNLTRFERTWFKVDILNVSINNKRNWLPLSCSLLLSFVYLTVTSFIGFITMTACVYDPVREIYFQLELLCKRWTSTFCYLAEESTWITQWERPFNYVIRLIKINTYSALLKDLVGVVLNLTIYYILMAAAY